MAKRTSLLLLLLLPVIASFLATQVSTAGVTTRVSISGTGAQASGVSASISADGRFVVFNSGASNLVPGDTNGFSDVFVHDRQTGLTSRVSVSSAGQQGNENSRLPSLTTSAISGDGRYVLFSSQATNLVDGETIEGGGLFVHDRQTGETARIPGSRTSSASISPDGRFIAFHSGDSHLVAGDLNNVPDIFVYDRLTGLMTRVSVSSTGNEANADGFFPVIGISNEGSQVCFVSAATNLVPGDTNYVPAIFVHDRERGHTTRVSDPAGGEMCAISADGRFVAFASMASNLVPGDTNGRPDIFVHDRKTGMTTRVSVSSTGEQSNGTSSSPSINADGRYVAFASGASNLAGGDTNRAQNVFVHDRQTGQTTLVNVSSAGEQANNWSGRPSISAEGRFVAFISRASNLVPGDTNGYYEVFVHDRFGNTEASGVLQEVPPAALVSSETSSVSRQPQTGTLMSPPQGPSPPVAPFPLSPSWENLPFCPEVGYRPEEPGIPACRVPPGGLPPIDWDALPPCEWTGEIPKYPPGHGRAPEPVGTPGIAIAMCQSQGVVIPAPPDGPRQEPGPFCGDLSLLTPEDRERLKTICPER